jgi:hypothetical protein
MIAEDQSILNGEVIEVLSFVSHGEVLKAFLNLFGEPIGRRVVAVTPHVGDEGTKVVRRKQALASNSMVEASRSENQLREDQI